MVLGKLLVPGRPTIWMIVGQGPIVLAVGAGGGCLDIFTLLYLFSSLSPSLWETARYKLKHCLNQPTNLLSEENKTWCFMWIPCQAEDSHENIKSYFEENKTWCFTWIPCQAKDPHENISLIFSEKQWKITQDYQLLQSWLVRLKCNFSFLPTFSLA